jgi:hypothetical protein
MLLDTPPSRPRIVQLNRRADPRIPVEQLDWLDAAQLAFGGSVALIDLSIGGASFEVSHRLRAGDETQLELVAGHKRTVASGRIVRSQIVAVRSDSVRYRGACAFDKPLPWTGQLLAAPARTNPLFAAIGRYEHWPGWCEIQAVFRHGRRLQGYTQAFSGNEATIDVWPSRSTSSDQRQIVPLSLLRAIRIIRDFKGDGMSRANGAQHARAFTPVEILFKNGDTMRGGTPQYEEDGVGFWLFPENLPATSPVFAISSAVAEIRVL